MVLQNPLFVSRNSRSSSFTIDQSLRFRSSEVAYLSRTPSSEGSRTTWTYSFWYKPGSRTLVAGTTGAGTVTFLSVNPSETNTTYAEFLSESDRLTFQGATVTWVMPDARIRDNSAWYHLVLICDTTNGTAADRVRFYLNGERQTEFVTNDLAGSGDELGINNTVEHTIGKRQGTTGNPLDGLLAEVNFLDGTAITDTSGVLDEFGEYNSDGVWVPKDVSELTSNQYGLNGYRLVFNSEVGVGNDSAPTGGTHASANNWTLNNIDEAPAGIWSNYMFTTESTSPDFTSTRQNFFSTQPQTRSFDGNSSTAGQSAGGANDGLYFFRPPTPISNVTKIEMKPTNGSGFQEHYINGTSGNFSGSNVRQTIYNGSAITVTTVGTDWLTGDTNNGFFQLWFNEVEYIDNTDNDIDYFDTPTRNYATYSPLINNDPPTLASGNLDATAINNGLVWATQKLPNKHLYAEFIRDGASDRFAAGIGNADDGFEVGDANDNDYAFMICYSEFGGNASIYNENTTATQTSLTAYSTGDVLGVEWRGDLATRQVNFYINGTQVGTSENVAAGDDYYFAVQRAAGSNPPEVLANFGQMPYLAAPSGVNNTDNGMHTNNLAAPAIKNPKDHMEAKLYEGTGVSNAITGMNFAPALIWIKGRTTTDNNVLVDTIRGTDSVIFPNSDDTAASSNGRFTNFNSDGFTVATTDGSWNTDDQNYVAWCWKAGTSFTPTVTGGFSSPSAFINTTAGFGMYKVTGSNSQGSFTTGLNQNADFILAKRLDTGNANWGVYHRSYCGAAPSAKLLHLNNSANPADKGSNIWVQTGTTIEVDSFAETGSNGDYIYYVWHEVPGYSSIGGYTGNNNTNGTFVYTGFKVGWLMLKETGGSASWYIYDSSRQTFNPHVDSLQADVTNNETTDPSSGSSTVDFLSNGFKQRQSSGGTNSAQSYVYVAFAESPFGGSGVSPATAF